MVQAVDERDERLEAANVLAHALHSNGGREAAVPLYEEVLRAVRRKSGGDNNEDAFSLMMSLAIPSLPWCLATILLKLAILK